MGRDHLRLLRQNDIIRGALRAGGVEGKRAGTTSFKAASVQEGAMISAESDICQAALRGQFFFFFPVLLFSPTEEIAALSSVITPADTYLWAAEQGQMHWIGAAQAIHSDPLRVEHASRPSRCGVFITRPNSRWSCLISPRAQTERRCSVV